MKPNAFLDICAAAFVRSAAPALRFLAYNRGDLPRTAVASDNANVQFRSTHYYEPTYAAAHLPEVIDQQRRIPALDMNEPVQIDLLRHFRWAHELAVIPLVRTSESRFAFAETQYGHGDADTLYNFVRHFRPARIFEIGSGDSTLVAQLAIARNRVEDPSYSCRQVCIEPYANPWLESTGAEIVRERVEHVDLELFKSLQANDILFIDSSHVIRPFGDVLREFHEIVPSVAPGVLVHIHDVFTPKDYPAKWLKEDRKLWNEQYLLEAFLAFNSEFEVIFATNWLASTHGDALKRACGHPEKIVAANPSSFWFRRLLIGAGSNVG